MSKRSWRLLAVSTQGNELVEFALVLPMLMMLLVGMFWFGRAFNLYETLTRAAREAASYGARPACALCSLPCQQQQMGGFPCVDAIGSRAAAAIAPAHIRANDLLVTLDPSRKLKFCSNPQGKFSGCQASTVGCHPWNGGRVWVCYCVEMTSYADKVQECGVEVRMAYPWKFPFPFTGLDNQLVGITAAGVARQEF